MIVSAGEAVVGTVAVDGDEVTGEPVGGVPVDVAESFTEPWLRSAWVIVYVAVKVAACPGCRVVLVDVVQVPPGVTLWQVGPEVSEPAGDVWVSVTPTVVKVTLPVLVTTNW